MARCPAAVATRSYSFLQKQAPSKCAGLSLLVNQPLPVHQPPCCLLVLAFAEAWWAGQRAARRPQDGALVMEKFLNRKPSPPPPNVPELALASEKPLAVKEIIALHREKAQCASCHSSFDPLGFGLENFDLLGQSRENETVGNIGKKSGKGRPKQIPIRADGVFPNNGHVFKNGRFDFKTKQMLQCKKQN